MVLTVSPVAVKSAPVKARSVSAASLYQRNTGLVMVVVDALSMASSPSQIVAFAAVISPAVDWWLIVKVMLLQIGRATSELQSLMRISYAVFGYKKQHNLT